MKRMVGCVVEIVSIVLCLCVYRSDQASSFRNEKDVRNGYRIVRLDVCSKFDVCRQVFKMTMIKHLLVISAIFQNSECVICTVNPLNAKLNPTSHLLTLLGALPILHVSRIRVNPPRRFLVAPCTSMSRCSVIFHVNITDHS